MHFSAWRVHTTWFFANRRFHQRLTAIFFRGLSFSNQTQSRLPRMIASKVRMHTCTNKIMNFINMNCRRQHLKLCEHVYRLRAPSVVKDTKPPLQLNRSASGGTQSQAPPQPESGTPREPAPCQTSPSPSPLENRALNPLLSLDNPLPCPFLPALKLCSQISGNIEMAYIFL